MSNTLHVPIVLIHDNGIHNSIFDSMVEYCRKNNYPDFCHTSLYLGDDCYDENGCSTYCGVLYGGKCWHSKQETHGYSFEHGYNVLNQVVENAFMHMNIDGHHYTLDCG